MQRRKNPCGRFQDVLAGVSEWVGHSNDTGAGRQAGAYPRSGVFQYDGTFSRYIKPSHGLLVHIRLGLAPDDIIRRETQIKMVRPACSLYGGVNQAVRRSGNQRCRKAVRTPGQAFICTLKHSYFTGSVVGFHPGDYFLLNVFWREDPSDTCSDVGHPDIGVYTSLRPLVCFCPDGPMRFSQITPGPVPGRLAVYQQAIEIKQNTGNRG